MHRYGNVESNSGIVAYDIDDDAIRVRFKSGGTYVYTHASAGWHHVERMKLLARSGVGLSRYINQHVSDRYDRKIG